MYITLYRKYRPKDFEEVAGETQIIQALKNSLKENRMAHAYMFTGPRGVGKTTTARIIAKGLNCLTNGITDTPCNSCKNCLAIDKGNFFDLTEIDAASNRGIDEIRSLKEKVNYKPVEGRKKVYIIDEVHMLTKEAFNALLKTLEEPPEHVLFILATTEPDKILDTIMSRCQRYDFMPLKYEETRDKIKEIASIENIDIDDKSIELIYEKSGGSMRDAVSIFEKVVSYNYNEKINSENCAKALGIIPENLMNEFYSIINSRDKNKGIKFIENLWENGIECEEFFREFANYLKKLIITKNENSETNFDIIEIIFDILFKFRFEEDKRLLGYLIVIKIFKGNSDTKEKIVIVEKKSIEENVVQVEEVKTGIDFFQKNWKNILNSAKERKISLYAFLAMAKPLRIEGNTLYIEFPAENGYHKVSMEKTENMTTLRDVIREKSGEDIYLKFEVAGEVQRKGDNSGIVRSVVDFFEGEIIK